MSPTAFRKAPVSLHLSMRGAWHLLCNGLLCPGILLILEMSTEVVQCNLVVLKGDWEVALLICCYSKLDILCRSRQIAWRCRHANILVGGTKVTWIVWKHSAVWGEAEVLELLPFQALQVLLNSWCLKTFKPLSLPFGLHKYICTERYGLGSLAYGLLFEVAVHIVCPLGVRRKSACPSTME